MLKKIVGVCVIVLVMCGSACAQVIIGDTQMAAWRQLRGFGLNLDSVMEIGRVRIYHADSIRMGSVLLHSVTIFLNDSQRVERMRFEGADLDTATFNYKYENVLVSPKIIARADDGKMLRLVLQQQGYVVLLEYDRWRGTILEEDYATGSLREMKN